MWRVPSCWRTFQIRRPLLVVSFQTYPIWLPSKLWLQLLSIQSELLTQGVQLQHQLPSKIALHKQISQKFRKTVEMRKKLSWLRVVYTALVSSIPSTWIRSRLKHSIPQNFRQDPLVRYRFGNRACLKKVFFHSLLLFSFFSSTSERRTRKAFCEDYFSLYSQYPLTTANDVWAFDNRRLPTSQVGDSGIGSKITSEKHVKPAAIKLTRR